MVECLVWDQDAAGSSPVTSTTNRPTEVGFLFAQKRLSKAIFGRFFVFKTCVFLLKFSQHIFTKKTSTTTVCPTSRKIIENFRAVFCNLNQPSYKINFIYKTKIKFNKIFSIYTKSTEAHKTSVLYLCLLWVKFDSHQKLHTMSTTLLALTFRRISIITIGILFSNSTITSVNN